MDLGQFTAAALADLDEKWSQLTGAPHDESLSPFPLIAALYHIYFLLLPSGKILAAGSDEGILTPDWLFLR